MSFFCLYYGTLEVLVFINTYCAMLTCVLDEFLDTYISDVAFNMTSLKE